jgi:branched-chain amino acid aminotransferase
MELKIIKAQKLKEKPDFSKLVFGRSLSDYMYVMDYDCTKGGWHDARIEPYANFSVDPSMHSLHYGQEIFEGLKAYRNDKDEVLMFRAIDNLNRMNKSAERMCMPTIDVDFVLDGLFKLIRMEKDWIPMTPGASLYIRPTMIATACQLGVKPGSQYKFFIILSPVGPYFGDKVTAIDLLIEDTYSRCAPGGTGEAKCAGNYAAGMLAAEEAAKKGYAQVLWLDAAEKKWVEEAGVMNIFFVIGDELVTPSLTGTILRGITRDSIIKIMAYLGYKVVERMISVDELVEEYKKNNLKECFACGTAAVVAPIGRLTYKGFDMILNNKEPGPVALTTLEHLVGVQKGIKDDPFSWVVKL